jgi:hypothetical protein
VRSGILFVLMMFMGTPTMLFAQIAPSEELPLVPDEIDEDILLPYPRWGLGIGLSTYSPDYGKWQAAMSNEEALYQNPGYQVPHHTLDLGTSVLYSLIVKFKCSKRISLLVEAGKHVGGDVEVRAASACVLYSFGEVYRTRAYPFIGAGVGHYAVAADEAYGSAIAQYYVLESIHMESANWGYHVTAGIEAGTPRILNFYAS